MVSLTIEGEVRQYPAGTSFLAISQEYQEKYPDDIVLVVYNNRLRELNKTAQRDGMLSFVTTADKTGKKTYRRSVTLLMQNACLLYTSKTVKKTVDRFLVQKICVFIIDVSSFRLFDKSFFVKNLHTQFFGQNVGDFVPAASTLSCDCYFHAY